MACATPCWDYTHRSGRCKCGTDASRAAIALPPLHTAEGGHSVSGPLVFPIEREEDEPLYTPESSAAPLREALVGFAVLVIVAVGAFALAASH